MHLAWLFRYLSTCPKSDVANIHRVCQPNCFSTSRHYYRFIFIFNFISCFYFYFTTSRSYSSGVTTQLSQFILSYAGALLLSKKKFPYSTIYTSLSIVYQRERSGLHPATPALPWQPLHSLGRYAEWTSAAVGYGSSQQSAKSASLHWKKMHWMFLLIRIVLVWNQSFTVLRC